MTLLIGYSINRINSFNHGVHKSHRRLGRISLIVAAVNIFLDITMMAAVLAQ